MSNHPDPAAAAEALAAIEHRQRQIVNAALVPSWYWWLIAGLVIVLGLAGDSGRPVVVAIVVPVCGLAIAGVSATLLAGSRGTRLRQQQLGGRGAVTIVGFVWLLVAVGLVLAFGLRAAGVPFPATLGCAAVAVGLVIAGPVVSRRLGRIALAGGGAR